MKILFATDGSEGSAVALDLLLDMPLGPADHVAALSVPVHHYFALDPMGTFAAELVQAEIDHAASLAEEVRKRFGARGIETSAHSDGGPVVDTTIAVARRERCDLIVVGSRGLGAAASFLMGSVARGLVRGSEIPVLVVRDRRVAPTRVLVGVDGSADSDASLELLMRLPLPKDATITLMHVIADVPGWPPQGLAASVKVAVDAELTRQAGVVLERASAKLGGRTVGAVLAERGRVAKRIVDRASSDGTDLVVIGARGTASVGRQHGTVADEIVHGARCAVLVVRAPAPVAPRKAVAERELVHVG
ncbi:MAG TPA: universal stress protein [Candidatus Limnocylindria bacterium]|nr:universal stress protein [Candidatus Limnocylindria bacterium]